MKLTWKSWFLLIAALALGCGSAFLVKSVCFDGKGVQVADDDSKAGAKERLLVANGFLAAGAEIDATNVRLVLTPEKDVPRDGVFSFSDFVGRKTTRDYNDGEPISLYDVEAIEETQESDAAFVPPGYSVVPIEICSAVKINGSRNYLKTTKLEKIVKPGDLIDIIAVRENLDNPSSERRRRLTSTTIVSGASVFSVDETYRLGEDGNARASTLSALLKSDELELVRKVSEVGKIKIVLSDQQDESNKLESIPNSDFSDALGQDNNGFIIPEQEDEAIKPSSDEDDRKTNESDSLLAAPIDNGELVMADFDGDPVFLNVSDSPLDDSSANEDAVVENYPTDLESSRQGVEPQGGVEPQNSDERSEALFKIDSPTGFSQYSTPQSYGASTSPLASEQAVVDDVDAGVDAKRRAPFKLKSPFVTKGKPGSRKTHRGRTEGNNE